MSQQLQRIEEVAPATYVQEARHLTKEEVIAQRSKVLEVMAAVMKPNVHYGKIPGCQKPSLYKPGSEVLLSTFRIAIDPIVTDLSTEDCIKYRVEVKGTSMVTGAYLGSGIGECSSDEEKYRWRKATCRQEFDSTPEDRRRLKWMKNKNGEFFEAQQVRTSPADVANTIVKMAKKRSQIDFTLTATAASDVFSQDIEDLAEELREAVADDVSRPTAQAMRPPQRKSETAAQSNGNGPTISEPQSNRLYAIANKNGFDRQAVDEYLAQHGYQSSMEIQRKDYDGICKAFGA